MKSNNEDKYDLGNEEYGYNGYKLVVSVRQKISERGNSRDSFLKQISSIRFIYKESKFLKKLVLRRCRRLISEADIVNYNLLMKRVSF